MIVKVTVPVRQMRQGRFSSAGLKPPFRKNLSFYLSGSYHRKVG
jgi:hypothetical protein